MVEVVIWEFLCVKLNTKQYSPSKEGGGSQSAHSQKNWGYIYIYINTILTNWGAKKREKEEEKKMKQKQG